MEFLAPALLWGMAGISVPIALHFIGRSKPIAHRFAALQFLVKSQKSSARAFKLRHILVLLMRILGILFVAFALARPILPDNAIPVGWGLVIACIVGLLAFAVYVREFITAACGIALLLAIWLAYPREHALADMKVRGDFVLVVDRSMSMSYAEPHHTRFEQARKHINELLDSLTPDSRVALVFATETAERALGRLSYRHAIVRKKMEDAKPAGRGLNLERALEAANDILRRDASDRPAFIVLLSDLQAANVQDARTALRKVGTNSTESARKPSLVIVSIGSEQARNAAVLSAQVPHNELQAGSRSTVTARLKPVDAERPLLVELFIDEQRVDQQLVEPRGHDVVEVELAFQTGSAGLHSGRINLPEADRMMMDQQRHFVYSAGRPATALIVEPPAQQSTLQNGARAKSFFLRAALQPNEAESNATGLLCVVDSPRELTTAALAKYRAVILPEAIALRDENWAALRKWVHEGGGLMLWAGPHAAEDNLRRFAFLDIDGQPPLISGALNGLAKWDKPPSISISQPEHPILARFSPGVLTVLRETRITRMVKVTPDPRDVGSNVILSAGGLPLLLESNFGRGRVLMFTVDAGLDASDFPRRGEAFVTLCLDALRYLAERENTVAAQLGQPLSLSLAPRPANGQVFWKKPGSATPIPLQVDVEPASTNAAVPETPLSLVLPPLEDEGIHTFNWFTSANNDLAQTRQIAVNVDATEADLTRASDELVKDVFSPWSPTITSKLMSALDAQAGQSRIRSQDFSAALLLLLAGILIAESFFANRLYAQEEQAAQTESIPAARATDGGAHGTA